MNPTLSAKQPVCWKKPLLNGALSLLAMAATVGWFSLAKAEQTSTSSPASEAVTTEAQPATAPAVEESCTPSHGYTLFGTLKYPATATHFDYVNPEAPKGGNLKLSVPASFDSVNLFILKGVKAPGLAIIYDTLMTASLDEPQSVYGLVAESICLPESRRWVEFKLRKQARWHDGTPITPEDVVFSLKMLKEESDPVYRLTYEPLEKAEVTGEDTVRITLDPDHRDAPLLAATLPVLPKAYYEKNEFNKTTLTPPLASGAYRIKTVDQGRSITFERVKDYWAENLLAEKGINNFDTIRYDVFTDETVGVEALKSRDYDLREEYIARNWAQAYNIPAVKDGRLIKAEIPNNTPTGMQSFTFNLRKPKFQDRRVREAIGLAFDYEWINRTLFFNAYARNNSFFQNSSFAASGKPSEAELKLLEPHRDILPPALFTEAYQVPVTDGSGMPRAQLMKADQLLKEAGWVIKNGKRVNEKTGEPLTIEFLLRQSTLQRVVSTMQQLLKRLGIESTMRLVDDSQYQKRLDEKDFDMISSWYNNGVIFPGIEQVSFWHSRQAEIPGSNNLAGVKNPAVDDALKALTRARTLEQLQTASRALDRILLWEHYVIPHYHVRSHRVIHWDIFGKPEKAPLYNYGLMTWWIDPAKVQKLSGK
jgi:microcin C transport system substrate-binding protein